HDRPGALDVDVGDSRDHDAAATATGDLFAIAGEDVEGAPANRADAQQAHPDRTEFFQVPLHITARMRAGFPAPQAARGFTRPSRRKVSRMPRTAWRIRCSFSIRAKRTWVSPYSPKPMPGETATLASSSSFLANSSEPMAL